MTNNYSEQKIMDLLKQFVVEELLDGKSMGLSHDTPLLEWGIINSIEVTRILAYIKDEFNVQIPLENIKAEYLRDLQTLTCLVESNLS